MEIRVRVSLQDCLSRWDMSPEIIAELSFLLHCFLMGVFITVLYDVLRIMRRIFPHNATAVSAEDFFYWIICSFLIFAMLIRENDGVLRWFAVAGAMTGMILYRKTFGSFLVKYLSLLIKRLLHLVGRFLAAILKPLNLVKNRLRWRRKRAHKRIKSGIRRVKKKLTESGKLLKILLYKQ